MIEFSPGLFRGPRLDKVPAGIKTVIDLQYDGRDVAEEEKDAPKFFWVATVAFSPPDKNRVAEVLNLLENAAKPVWMHCLSGVDRTGFMVGKFRKKQGWSRWRAFKEMVKMGMHPWFYWWGFFL